MTQRERQILQMIQQNPMISQQELAQQLGITRSSAAVHISNLMSKGWIAGRGYVLRSGSYAVVAGGVNVDIGGRSFGPLVAEDSNPGRVSFSLGGVGRNIAHNLSLLGADVRMLTAYGDDLYGQQVEASFGELGIDAGHALKVPGARTSTYLYLTDPRGEMALAVSDMAVCDRLTPAYLRTGLSLLQNARLVIADTNLPRESLQFLTETCTAPIFCDPVSTGKAAKLLPILSGIHTLKPNRLEAEVLTGISVKTPEDAQKAACRLLEMGVKRVFLSLGADGVCAAQDDLCEIFPSLPGNMVNTTGCGDAFMAAIGWAFLEGLDLEQTARAGLAAASLAMESQETINPAMCAPALRERMAENTRAE